MTTPRRQCLKTTAAALALMLTAGGAAAQAWPSRAVRVVLGAPAGAAPDTAARVVAERLSVLWSQPVIIENRPGAGGTLAMDAVQGARDGHTVLLANAGSVVVTPRLLKAAKHDPLHDFLPLGMVADAPLLIVGAREGADASLADLLKTAKAQPGRVSVGSTELASLPYLVGQQMGQLGGVTFLHVPFSTPSQAAQALVNGDVQYQIDGIGPLLPLVQGNRVRPIAVTGERRLPGPLADIPLAKDTLPGFVAVGWFVMLGPKSMPADVASKFNRDLNSVLSQPQVAARLEEVSLFPRPMSPSDTRQFLQSESDRWGAVIQKVGLQPM